MTPYHWKKEAEELSAILCALCLASYPAKYAFIVIFIYDTLFCRWSCYSQFVAHFFCSDIESRTSNRAFFPRSQSHSLLVLFSSGGNGDLTCHEVSGTIFVDCVRFLLYAVSCRSLWNTVRSHLSGISSISCQFEVYFLSRKEAARGLVLYSTFRYSN